MPGLDGTGPEGVGPMTGGRRGFCGPYRMGAAVAPYGDWRWAGYGPLFDTRQSREQELDLLRSEAKSLRKSLEGIHARIRGLASERQ